MVGDDDVAAGTVGVNRRGWDDQARARACRSTTFVAEVADEVARKGLPEDRAPAAAPA